MAVVLHVGAGTRVADAPDGGFAPPQRDVLAGIYEDHYDRLMGFFVRRTHDRVLAEDLAHDTMMRLVRSSDTFDETRPAWPYLKVAANNVLIDHLRRADRQVDLDVEEQLESGDVCEPCVDDRVVLRAMLDQAMDQLPERQRIAVDLRYQRGWSMSDGADFLGVSPGTFSQLLFRARQTMREYLEDTATGVSGVVVPVLLALRVRLRTWSARAREIAQTPVTAVSMEAMAGVVVAAGLGLSAVSGTVTPSLDIVAQELRADEAWGRPAPFGGAVLTTGIEPDTVAASTDHFDSAPEGTKAHADPVPAEKLRVESALTDDSEGALVLEEDQERFTVSSEVHSRTGMTVFTEGDVVSFSCGTPVLGEACDLGE